jgi:hypothetical protein
MTQGVKQSAFNINIVFRNYEAVSTIVVEILQSLQF